MDALTDGFPQEDFHLVPIIIIIIIMGLMGLEPLLNHVMEEGVWPM